MTVFKILKFPHVLLRKKSTPVEKFTPDLAKFTEAMVDTMYAFDGIGLAAPQVGILKRIIVVDIMPYLKNESVKDWHGNIKFSLNGESAALNFPLTLINPTIVKSEGETDFPFDGCLSLPGVEPSQTLRAKFIELHAKDASGNDLKIECDGIMSICLQHELDHLEGVLFIDRVKQELDPKVVQNDIEDFENDPSERKRIRKLKIVDARNQTYSFA